MSSLLQFEGKIEKRGVHLMALLDNGHDIVRDGYKPYIECFEDVYQCECGEVHPAIYTFCRKPRGVWGPWVVFRWCNQKHVPDLSTPMSLKPGERPRDLKRMSNEESTKYWHS
jgi:hypothetical protein